MSTLVGVTATVRYLEGEVPAPQAAFLRYAIGTVLLTPSLISLVKIRPEKPLLQKFVLRGLVHSIGFAPSDQLEGNFVDVTSREGFKVAHDISSYSFTALAKAAKPMLNDSSALLTLTYLGAIQTIPNYNVMGLAKASLEANTRFLAASMGRDNIRVNAISAGPIKTLAASGVKNFRKMLTQHSERAPLGRTVTTEEVGNTAAFLCSDYASGITGEITYVDAGFNTAAMPLTESEE